MLAQVQIAAPGMGSRNLLAILQYQEKPLENSLARWKPWEQSTKYRWVGH